MDAASTSLGCLQPPDRCLTIGLGPGHVHVAAGDQLLAICPRCDANRLGAVGVCPCVMEAAPAAVADAAPIGSMRYYILVWLRLAYGHADSSLVDPLHLAAPSWKFVYLEMKRDWEGCGRAVPAFSTFLHVMKPLGFVIKRRAPWMQVCPGFSLAELQVCLLLLLLSFFCSCGDSFFLGGNTAGERTCRYGFRSHGGRV